MMNVSMGAEATIRRYVPRYERLIPTAATPEQVTARLESALETAVWWSPQASLKTRIMPSVSGSNVYVSARPRPFWSIVIFGLILLALVLRRASTEHDVLLALCLAALVVAVEQAFIGVVRCVDEIETAIRGEEVGSPYRAWTAHALSTVLIAIIFGAFALRVHGRFRDELLMNANFIAGSPRQVVTARLGRPDLELSGDEIRRFATGFDPGCVVRAVRQLDYYGSRFGSGVYFSAYLDGGGRVICVEHGRLR